MRNAKSEEWVEVGESDGPKRFYRQSGLTKGEKYSFRVRYARIEILSYRFPWDIGSWFFCGRCFLELWPSYILNCTALYSIFNIKWNF
jgi:hypothetical protein